MSTHGHDALLIDVHSHFVTDGYVEAAKAAGHTHPDGMPGYPAWDAERHLALMDQWGVRTSVLSISSPGVHFGDDQAARALAREVNEFGARIARGHRGRFGHFASLPLPDVAGSIEEAGYALEELGSRGLAIETNAEGSYLGDERYEPLWTELDARRAVVFVHPTSPCCWEAVSLGRPRPMLEFIFDSTRTVSDLVFSGVLRRHPDIEWIFTHGGGTLPLLADRIELFRSVFMAADPDEPSAPEQIRRLWFDMAGTPFPNQIPALVKAFGAERLLYGSDYCWTPDAGTTAQVKSVDDAPQPAGDTWRELTTRNALRLLPGLDRPHAG
ncbi:MAG: amidohydrolase [Solirubrobacterales bacterium]|nr:amidohydrolase [Solirubrobacterales bacterium]